MDDLEEYEEEYYFTCDYCGIERKELNEFLGSSICDSCLQNEEY